LDDSKFYLEKFKYIGTKPIRKHFKVNSLSVSFVAEVAIVGSCLLVAIWHRPQLLKFFLNGARKNLSTYVLIDFEMPKEKQHNINQFGLGLFNIENRAVLLKGYVSLEMNVPVGAIVKIVLSQQGYARN